MEQEKNVNIIVNIFDPIEKPSSRKYPNGPLLNGVGQI